MIEITAVEPFPGENDEPLRVESESLIRTRFASYLSDESGLGPGKASVLFVPNSELQIAQFLKEMNERKIPVTVSGGRTGIVGGAVPLGGAIISLDSMNQITGITWNQDRKEWLITAQPGIRLRDLQRKIATKNLGKSGDEAEWTELSQFQTDPDQYFYPPDPTEDTASLGGTIATDASGARTFFYGRTRGQVRAIRVVLVNGEVIDLCRGEYLVDSSNMVRLHHLDGTATNIRMPTYTRPQVKCAMGYYSAKNMDLLDFFIGSEGTLGIISSIEIALKKKTPTAMFLAFFESTDEAIAFVIQLRSLRCEALTIHSLEYLDVNALRLLHEINEDRKLGMKLPNRVAAILSEFGYKEIEEAVQILIEQLQAHSSLDDAISAIDERDKERLRILRHAIPEEINRIIAQRKKDIPGLHKLGTDTAVSDERLVDLMKLYHKRLDESKLDYYIIGHIAENHLHVNILPRSLPELEAGQNMVRRLAQDAVSMDGAASAEHGVGKLKRDFMSIMFRETEIQEMISTKRAFDPNWILSPGNVFDLSNRLLDGIR